MNRFSILLGLAAAFTLTPVVLAEDIGPITHDTKTLVVEGDIHVTGNIDAGSTVTLTSKHGSIFIDGKIDGGSHVTLRAGQDIEIGRTGGPEDKRVDGGSTIDATAGGKITLGSRIDGGSSVHLHAGTGIDIEGRIDNGHTTAWLKSDAGTIELHDRVDGGVTVTYWPGEAAFKIDNQLPSANANLICADW